MKYVKAIEKDTLALVRDANGYMDLCRAPRYKVNEGDTVLVGGCMGEVVKTLNLNGYDYETLEFFLDAYRGEVLDIEGVVERFKYEGEDESNTNS